MKQFQDRPADDRRSESTRSEFKADPTNHHGGAVSSALLEKPGAPRVRGSELHASFLKRARQKLEDSLWFPVVSKLAVGGLVLLSAAYLGHRAQAEETYGEVVSAKLASASSRPDSAQRGVSESEKLAENSELAAPFPSKTEATPSSAPPPCEKASEPSAQGVTPDGRVILNEATAQEMTQLPSVGPARAEAIVKLRKRLGRFKKVSDLLRVRGIGWKTLKKMKDKAVLDRPPEVKEEEPLSEGPALLSDNASDSQESKGDGA